MRGLLAVSVLAAALSGCTSVAGYEAALESWVGGTEAELVSQWGPPQNVYVAPDGTRVLTYSNQRSVSVPGTPPSYSSTVIGNTVYTQPVGGTQGFDIDLSCSTSFSIDKNGRIASWSHRGNDCRA
jgi:uncharacterized protein YceK